MTAPQIIVQPRGRLANQMFQAMLAIELRRRVPGSVISGLSIPEWDIASTQEDAMQPSLSVVSGHQFNLNGVAYLLRAGVVRSVVIRGWFMRLSYYGPPQRYCALFKSTVAGRRVNDNQILLNVRAEDIENGWHSKYYPLPFSFYDYVIESTGLQPVFMGQLDAGDYVKALKQKFRGATFLPNGSPLEDFQTIRHAKQVALSISSFSWLAAWLSEEAESIHLPVAGLYDPQSSDTQLLPVDDLRYQFYNIAFPDKDERKLVSAANWAGQPFKTSPLSIPQVKAKLLKGFLRAPAKASKKLIGAEIDKR